MPLILLITRVKVVFMVTTSLLVFPISWLIKEHVLFSTLPNKAASHMDFHTHQVAFSLGILTSSNGPSLILYLDLFQVLLARPMS